MNHEISNFDTDDTLNYPRQENPQQYIFTYISKVEGYKNKTSRHGCIAQILQGYKRHLISILDGNQDFQLPLHVIEDK